MSKTLELIMKHWTQPLPDKEVSTTLPFNIESFCRENDSTLVVLEDRIKFLESELEDVYYEFKEEYPDYDD